MPMFDTLVKQKFKTPAAVYRSYSRWQ